MSSDTTGPQIARAADLLHRLWGDELPVGPAPWETIAADVYRLYAEAGVASGDEADVGAGAEQGLVTTADALPLALLAELLGYLPDPADFRGRLPPALERRLVVALGGLTPVVFALRPVLARAAYLTGARTASAFRRDGRDVVLQAETGMTAGERVVFGRMDALDDRVVCQAVRSGHTETTRTQHYADGGLDRVVSAVAIPFMGADGRGPASGGLALHWDGADRLPPLEPVLALTEPAARRCEHLLTTAGRPPVLRP